MQSDLETLIKDIDILERVQGRATRLWRHLGRLVIKTGRLETKTKTGRLETKTGRLETKTKTKTGK